MSQLSVTLLGAPELQRDRAPLRFDTRKAVALVALLAVGKRRFARDELTALLWPESDQARGRAALRRTLSAAGGIGPALVVDRGGVCLDLARTTCDVTEFRACRTSDDPAAARRAVELYRGDFLAGFTLRDSVQFEEWRLGVADGLRQDLDHLLGVLVTDLIDRGQFDDAIRHAQHRLALDPLREQAHQDLIRLYAWSGQRTAALRQYRTCVRTLERELGVPPLPETTAVYDDARAGRLARPAATSPADGPEQPPAGLPPRPFVGRSSELATLKAALARSSEVPQAVAVVGETGMGASSLVERFGGEVARGGAPVVLVRGHEGEQSLPFAAATDLLRGVVRQRPEALAELTPAQRTSLAHLLPSLGSPGPDDPDPSSPGARSRLLAAVHDLIVGLAPRPEGVALVVCDDVHWFDQESCELLSFLLRRQPPGLMTVLTWHGSSSPVGVAAAVSEGLRNDSSVVLRLSTLGRAEVRELLERLGATAEPEQVDDVLLRTGGLPLLVTEDALSRVERHDPSGQGMLVDELVQARLDAAGPTTGQVLTAVAVVAAPTDSDLLRAVSGRTEAEVVTAVEDAVARGLLVEIPERAAYDFPHDTLRQVVRGRTSAARRRLLHSRAADALAERYQRPRASVAAGTVAQHLGRCGREEEAAGWHVVAADQARRLYAHATAAEHLECALALGHEPASTHIALGDARLRLGQYEAAIASYEQAAALVDGPRASADVEHRLAEVHHRLGDWDVAQAHLEAALALLEDAGADAEGGPQRSQLLADLALVALRRGDLDTAERSARSAARLAGGTTETAGLAQAHNVLGVVAARRGDALTAREKLTASLALARRLDDPSLVVAALNNLARLDAETGETATAMTLGEQALDLGIRYGDRHHVAALHANLADLLHRAGRQNEAQQHLRESAALFADLDRHPDRRPEIWKLVEW